METEEEAAILNYFTRGHTYSEMVALLKHKHNLVISHRTLRRRLKTMGLKRKNLPVNIDQVRRKVSEFLDGPGSSGGYRSVWHSLRMGGEIVPRETVRLILKELDPEGVAGRKAHKLVRRTYRNSGPNSAWHIDGYDKLKPHGFPIHGAIDGWSRKIIWLHVAKTNNCPKAIARFYLDAVENVGGAPEKLVSDMGTENHLAASMQNFFLNDETSHKYVKSTRNQRIESWWAMLRRQKTNWWRSYFIELQNSGVVDLTRPFHRECMWFSFSCVLQRDLDSAREHWNSHLIRRSCHETISGRPDALYDLPTQFGGQDGLLTPVQPTDMEAARQLVFAEAEPSDSDEVRYFKHVMRREGLHMPDTWRDAEELCLLLIMRSGQ